MIKTTTDLQLFSKKLNDFINLDQIPNLSNEELIMLNNEFSYILASVESNYIYLQKRFELDYDLDDILLIKTKKKYLIVKRFIELIDQQLERNFQKSQGNVFDTDEDYRDAMDILKRRRKYLYDGGMKTEVQRTFIELLKETYGEDQINKIKLKSQVVANQYLTKNLILQ